MLNTKIAMNLMGEKLLYALQVSVVVLITIGVFALMIGIQVGGIAGMSLYVHEGNTTGALLGYLFQPVAIWHAIQHFLYG